MGLNRNINDDSTLAYLFNKTRQGASDALQKAIDAINATIASIQTALNNKVSKTGDTMSGSLTIKKDSSGQFFVKNPNIDSTSTATAESNEYCTSGHLDKNGRYIGYFETAYDTVGDVRTSVSTRRFINGVNATNSLILRINNAGSFFVDVTSPEAWRTGIGAVSKSGDTMTSTLEVASASDNTHFIRLKNTATDITDTSFPSTGYPAMLSFLDKNGKAYGYVLSSQRTDGATGIAMWAMSKDQTKAHGFGLRFDNNGNRIVALDEAKPWQDALGISDLQNYVGRISNSKSLFLRTRRTYSSVTFNAAGYVQIDTISSIATAINIPEINWFYLISMMIQGFNDGNVYGLARGSAQENIYAIGKPGATTGFSVQYFFANSTMDVYP